MARSFAIGRALARRALTFTLSVAVAGIVVVGLFARAPGDALDTLKNGEDVRAALETEWGLGGSFYARVGTGMARLAVGDFGESLTYKPGVPVVELVQSGAIASAALALPAVALSLGLAFAAAASAGAGSGRRPGRLTRLWSILSSTPLVLAALLTIHVANAAAWFAMEHGWIPRPGWFALPEEPGFFRTSLAVLLLGFASATFAQLARRAEGELHTLDAATFVAAEHARGGSIPRLYARHLIVPSARLAADTLTSLFTGLIVVERAFNLPGAGTSFWEACSHRDWPVAAGLGLAFAVAVAAARLAAESLAVFLDPRVREASP